MFSCFLVVADAERVLTTGTAFWTEAACTETGTRDAGLDGPSSAFICASVRLEEQQATLCTKVLLLVRGSLEHV